MKKLPILPILLLFALISSCNREIELQPKTVEYFVLEQLQNSVTTEYYRGREKYDALRETCNDISEKDRSTRASELFGRVLTIDTVVNVFLGDIRALKKEMIRDKAELKRMAKQVSLQPTLPFAFRLDKIRISPAGKSKQKLKRFKRIILK